MGAIIAGQTSVKAPEREAFEEHLPKDVHIISCHSMHGPKVDPTGQPLVSTISSFVNFFLEFFHFTVADAAIDPSNVLYVDPDSAPRTHGKAPSG